LDPPIFKDIVGGGAGGSDCSGRSMGSGGIGAVNALAGTNSKAPALSRLILVKGQRCDNLNLAEVTVLASCRHTQPDGA
jgi:hypothetical protein